jgi:hypothetical protein
VAAAYLLVDRLPRQPWTALGALAASALALFATPALWATGSYYAGVLHNDAARRAVGQWGRISLDAPFDVVFIISALILVALALRAPRERWEIVALVSLLALLVRAARGELWFAFFIATPAAVGIRRSAPGRPLLAKLFLALLLALCVLGFVRGPTDSGASQPLLRRALAAAAGTPILAEDVLGEQVARAGGRIWVGNPLDAFDQADQRLYLDWLDGRPRGDAALAHAARAVFVRVGSNAQRRLARVHTFRELARDEHAIIYLRENLR